MISSVKPNSSTAGSDSGRRETSSDKTLSIMDLFTPERPEWTIDAMVSALGLSSSTVYRYVRSLVAVGLVFSVRSGRYLLGPGIIHYDRQLRLADPLIHAAQPVLRQLAGALPSPGIVFIARVYRNQVMSMLEQRIGLADFATRYDRGQLMPLYQGAPGLAILAYAPIRNLKRGFLRAHQTSTDPTAAWRQFRRQLRITRNRGFALDEGDIDANVAYLAVPLLNVDGEVAGSLTLGMPRASVHLTQSQTITTLRQAAQQISEQAGRV